MTGQAPAGSPGGERLTIPQALALADQRLALGDAAAAQALCRQIVAVEPRCAPALHCLGVIASMAGDLAAAIDLVGQATRLDGAPALYFCNLCEMCRQAGRLDEALDAGRRALAQDPDHPQALNNLGIVEFERGDAAAAASLYRRAIARAPGYAEARNNLGNALRAQRRYEDAVEAYGQALALRPLYADALNNLGATLRDMGRLAASEIACRKAQALEPHNTSVLGNLALALEDLERPEEAVAVFEAAHRLDPGDVTPLTRIAQIRFEQDRFDEAEAFARRALALRADDPEAVNLVGLVALRRGQPAAALEAFHRAIEHKPDFAEAYSNAGNALKELGRIAEARAAHERAVELDPRQAGFFLNLSDGWRFTADDPHFLGMRALEADIGALAPVSRMHLHFALGKAYDDLGDPRRAFAHFGEAARIKRARVAYDEAATLAMFDRLRAAFSAEVMARAGAGGDPSDAPVFVVGMPRSGTTLVEQILASHPRVHGAGELDDLAAVIVEFEAAEGLRPGFPEWAARLDAGRRGRIGARYVARLRRHAARAWRITDKMPANFMLVGLIGLTLPNARVIHVLRDPADTCLSCFTKLFADEQNHTYNLAELGRYYRKYAELMAHWRAVLPAGRLFEVRYEEVVADLEGQARRLIAHCGLAWDARCLAFHETPRTVRTASAHQVRRPIYASSAGRWRDYREELAPLFAELGPLAPD